MTSLLRPGDLLLYRGKLAVRVKTWSTVGHCELYLGAGRTLTARSEGVDIFALPEEEPRIVLRPCEPFDTLEALARFNDELRGQPYDWIGLFLSFVAVRQGRKNRAAFCSEVCTRVYRYGGFEPFTPEVDADAVAPGTFLYSPKFCRL